MTTGSREHWEAVYAAKAPSEVSWFERSPATSLGLIDGLELEPDAPVIDVGGGASHLAAGLLDRGFEDITVADISADALGTAQAELGRAASRIEWVVGDVRDHDFGRRFALWHDRAVFHFMVSTSDREAYTRTAARSVEPGGDLIVATFGPAGPTSCSGLPVVRYGADELAEALGEGFEVESSRLVDHETPSGATQQFIYAHARRALPLGSSST